MSFGYAPAVGRPGFVRVEEEPDVHMDEYEAQAVLNRPCPYPNCFAEPGVSCTVPVEVDYQPKRQQVLAFHRQRVSSTE